MEKYKEIKDRFLKYSNNYIMSINYDDILYLFKLIDNLYNHKFNFLYGIMTSDYLKKDKIRVKIEELEKENEQNGKDLERAINFLNFNKIDIVSEKIFINMCIKDTLKSLLDEK